MTDHLPNFLIVGAAKSGTTSMYYYLQDHPEIYFPAIKEPKFLSSEVLKDQYITRNKTDLFISSFEEYRNLFRMVQSEEAIGEASTDTLFHHESTIPRIKKYIGNPKIIIMLRNPPYAAYSMYSHLIRDNREEHSFEDALAIEDERIRNNWQSSYYYKTRFLYARQVKAFLESFAEVKILIYEEFIKDIPGTIKDICSFLEIDPDYQPAHTSIRYNTSGVPRIRWINEIFLMRNPIQLGIRKIGTALLSRPVYVGLRDTIRQKNIVKLKMKPETFTYLKEFYQDDILALQNIIHKDLSIWLNAS